VGLAFHPESGNLFVADAGQFVKQFDGTTGDFLGVFSQATTGNLSSASGLAFHPATGNLFVSDPGFGDVREFDGTTGDFLGVFGETAAVLDHPFSLTFRIQFCGDGLLDLGEQCDDANNDDGDGCSAQCEIEELLIDHFKCYKARHTAHFEQRVVTLTDQFVSRDVILQGPIAVCNPVDKNGEGIIDETAHLTCYRLGRDKSGTKLRVVTTEDQFGEVEMQVKIGDGETLCVPSQKRD